MTPTQPKPAPAFSPYEQLAYHAKVHANENRRAGNEAVAVIFEAEVKRLMGVRA